MRLIPRGFLFAALALSACAGTTAEAPLTVTLGLSHEATDKALQSHQYCRKVGEGEGRRETYPRCERAGAEWGESWVTASFEGNRLIELRRFERYSDDGRAMQRWNELVEARSKTTPPSDEALQALKDKGLLEAGTRAVKAFRADDATVIGVYLLTPSPPEEASVLEKISYVRN